MTFLSWAALAVGLLVVAPLVAHLLRRRPPQEQSFAATDLVPPHAAVAERRTAIEDRALFSVRVLSVLALALLGATPFIKCSRLSLARQGGASVALAIVVDDSLSMRAASGDDDEQTRFKRATQGAEELFAGLQPGDAVTIVMAGKPARVALAATTNLDAARGALDRLRPSDRGTDLQGAVKLAAGLLSPLEHVDKRIVVLSDLAVARTQVGRQPLAVPGSVKLWVPLDELRGELNNCGIVQADRQTERVVVQLACSERAAAQPIASAQPSAEPDQAASKARAIEVRAGDEVLVSTPLAHRSGRIDVTLRLSEEARSKHGATQLFAVLSGRDAIAVDDAAPVLAAGGDLRVGVVADSAESQVATGGPPPIEQALTALRLGLRVKPLAETPEQEATLRSLALLVVEDAPGFTPAQRRALAMWVERGGVLLLALGERAAAAPLGSGFEPMLPALVRWEAKAPAGMDLSRDTYFGEAAAGMDQLNAKGRAQIELSKPDEVRILSRWSDGDPLLIERRMGRGVVYALTLPLDTSRSDLMLRPGALAMLHQLIDTARSRGGASRTTVGTSWPLDAFDEVQIALRSRDDTAVEQRLAEAGPKRFVPEQIGLYDVTLDGQATLRVAALDLDEVTATTLPPPEALDSESLGSQEASVNMSSYLAVLLLALFALELILRLTWRRRAATQLDEDGGGADAGGQGPGAETAGPSSEAA